ncbi:4'-phosphopantetheinyl transferase family protein [Desulfovibrio legallii]|uniref:4'-phosphopantetheinyl transferase n=1 Tax=Desulfovibrio legallii TaxID=571438 RepID=A0A1G7JIY5_9BACT|nr:4'-phosphopantetheinyl transferase superfamily protein [Desulfovibrio legallii]SDF24449.1 4'-phosphopantetheinyl transferase [Desulfovibrio legallii]
MRAWDFLTAPLPAPPVRGVLCLGLYLDDPADWIAACAPLAAEEENRAADRFVQPWDAARHLAGRVLTRRMLGAALGRRLTAPLPRTAQGKPFCPDVGLEFSLSHAGHMVWAAFCRQAPVGVDVEEIRPLPDLDDLAAQLHPEENAQLRALPPALRQAAFYRCWTRKEAVLKALGTGLFLPLADFQTDVGEAEADWLLFLPRAAAAFNPAPDAGPPRWTCRDLPAPPGYACAVAAMTPKAAVHVHHC